MACNCYHCRMARLHASRQRDNTKIWLAAIAFAIAFAIIRLVQEAL